MYPSIYPLQLNLPFNGQSVIVVLHPRCRVLHHPLGGVGIDVQGEAGGGVAQEVLHGFYIRPGGNGNRRRRVSEVMRPCVWSAYAGGNFLKPPVEGKNRVVLPRFIGEYQVVRVVPNRASFQAVLRLSGPFGPEILERYGRRFNRAGFVGFRGGGNVIFPGALGLLELLADSNPALLKIHLIPGQAQAFPLTEASEQTEGVGVAHRRGVNS